MKEHRLDWIDACKALALLFVIFAHGYRGDKIIYFSLTSAIKLPLFFFISGYLFNINKSFKKLLSSLLMRIMIPWIFLGVIETIIADYIIYGICDVLSVLHRLLFAKILWYLPCYFSSIIIFYIIIKLSSCNKILTILSFTFFGLYLGNTEGLFSIFKFNVACTAQSFLYLGYLYKQNEEYIVKRVISNKYTLWLLISSYFILAAINVMLYPTTSVDMHRNWYNFYPLTFLMTVVGSLLCIYLTRKLFLPKFFLDIGKYSLIIYCLEGFIRGALRLPLLKLGFWYPKSLLFSVLLMVGTILIALYIRRILTKYVPILIGEK